MWRLQPSNMAATVFVLLLAGVRGLQLEDREERICAFSRSPKGAEPVSTNELRGELQENGTIRCSRGSRCYGLWERRADGEMELLNQDPPGGQVAVHFGPEPEETTVLLETRPRGGGRYLVVDCGDYSDFTVYEVLEGGALKKLHHDYGYLGGRDVDDEFKTFLSEIFSDELWEEYEANFPNEVQEMMDDFLRVKHVDEDVQICCPENLREQAEKEKNIERFFDSVGGASWDDGRIRISRDALRSFYDQSLQTITKKIREISAQYSNIGCIVLVGGLAESQILRQNITDQFGSKYKVLCPLRPQEAVLKGAVELGRNPKLVLPQRKGPACFRCFS